LAIDAAPDAAHEVAMKPKLSRRSFVRAAAVSGGAFALSGCGSGEQLSAPPKTSPETGQSGHRPGKLSFEEAPRETLLNFAEATAEVRMRSCHHCAQATFLAIEEVFGLDGGPIAKALTPIPGIAERGETCGAVVGSLMAIGLVFGRDNMEDWGAWRAALVPSRAFCARFEKEFGSTMCGDLLEKHFGKRYNLADPVELAEYQAAKPGPAQVCGGFVRKAARIASEIILDTKSAQVRNR
jgi:C_GCAxxG_C_C family probable redox protein